MKIITTDLIFIWTGSHASIPAGWERAIEFDGLYIKGSGTQNPLATGGNATHNHTVTGTHTHSANGTHQHSITLGTLTSGGDDRSGSDTLSDHEHGSFNSASASGGSLGAVGCSYGAVSNDPPYHEVIFIRPSEAVSKLPNGVVCFTDETSAIADFDECDGNNGTPDLRNKFLKGAGTEDDAGTTGGSTTNVHTVVHTSNHSVASHTHGNATSNTTTNPIVCDCWGGTPSQGHIHWNNRNHTHTVSLNSASDTIDNTNPDVTCTETVQPLHKKLLALMQNSGGDLLPAKGIVALYVGSLSKLPYGWDYLDGQEGRIDMRNYYVKCANDDTEIGDVDGANTHTHVGDNHTHTSLGHNHGVTQDNHTTKGFTYDCGHNGGYTSHKFTDEEDLHATTCGNQTVVYNNATTNANESSNEPQYKVVAFLKYNGKRQGASIMNAFVRS